MAGNRFPLMRTVMRIRAAQTLVFTREGGELEAFNYLTRHTFNCSPDLLTFLTFANDWTSLEECRKFLPFTSDDELCAVVEQLIANDALVAEGSDLAAQEDEFRATWRWGVPTALFHFSLRDKTYRSLEESGKLQLARAAEAPQPELYLTNPHDERAIRLPRTIEKNELLQLMSKRRTVRHAAEEAVTLEQLSDCLFAGLGIVGETRNVAGKLPLAMTPSGGARNPYEAYVYARDVEGLAPGIYHYSAFEHTLSRVGDGPDDGKASRFVGGQDWVDEMPCVIFLCARLERTMWKYDDANAYCVVLIEAGHIGQNFMLAATRHGLSACPTAALSHSEILRHLGNDGKLTHSPVYALTLGRPYIPQPEIEAAPRLLRIAG